MSPDNSLKQSLIHTAYRSEYEWGIAPVAAENCRIAVTACLACSDGMETAKARIQCSIAASSLYKHKSSISIPVVCSTNNDATVKAYLQSSKTPSCKENTFGATTTSVLSAPKSVKETKFWMQKMPQFFTCTLSLFLWFHLRLNQRSVGMPQHCWNLSCGQRLLDQ